MESLFVVVGEGQKGTMKDETAFRESTRFV